MRCALVAVIFLALGGCSGSGGADTVEVKSYQCEDLAVTAEFHGTRRVLLNMPGNRLFLLPTPAASGAKYADAQGNEFWTRDGALLTLAGEPLRRCTEQDANP